MTSDWTNLSVQRLAGAHDPLEYIVQRARELALDAMAAGWSGPPFDPLSLAGHLGMRVVPRDGLTDARLISDEQGFVVEYNPLRPRGRLRYSIRA